MVRFRRGVWLLAMAIAVAMPLWAGSATAQPPYPEFCDVNGDHKTTITDALLIAQDVVQLTDIGNLPGPCKGDVNGASASRKHNPKVTIVDALLVAQHVVGLI